MQIVPKACAALICVLMLVQSGTPAYGQDTTLAEAAWRPIFEDQGLAFSYIFYREADTVHNGVVIRLINSNPYDLSYAFRVVFRADNGDEVEQQVNGTIGAQRMKTGESDGLFWIPFLDEREINELGLRKWEIEQLHHSDR